MKKSFDFKAPKTTVRLELPDHDGFIEFPSDPDDDAPINIDSDEFSTNFWPSDSSYSPNTAIRIPDQLMWHMELIKRSSKNVGNKELSSYGSIVKFAMNSLMKFDLVKHDLYKEKQAEDLLIAGGLDAYLSNSIPLALKKLRRFFYFEDGSVREIDIATLTYSQFYIVRILQLAMIDLSLLKLRELRIIEWILGIGSFKDGVNKSQEYRDLSFVDLGDISRVDLRGFVNKLAKLDMVKILYCFEGNSSLTEITNAIDKNLIGENNGFLSIRGQWDEHEEILNWAYEMFGPGPDACHFSYLGHLSLLQGEFKKID